MNIGAASKASGVSAKMIRYYESIGLIRSAYRSESNYRIYGQDEVHILRFVKRARNLGFSIEETSALLGLWRDKRRASADVKRIAQSHIDDLRIKIAAMQEMVATLKHLAECCSGDDRPNCPILNSLAQAGSATLARALLRWPSSSEARNRLACSDCCPGRPPEPRRGASRTRSCGPQASAPERRSLIQAAGFVVSTMGRG